ncbi:hypothetical protein T4D_13299 [Trichinella pseudospiralis]|uniref:Uncharacterized protein n=1 Tax=Trichinella pseudospiralis TaxID=6337 RepID=A0A0V1FIK9_TRIPS|nr:hypothetical protein T4D_13299 [Trichinella pseudospiralis]
MKNSVLKFIRLQSALNIRCMCVLRKLRISVILAASIHKSQPPMPYNLTLESGSLDMSGLVDQSGSSVWNCGTGAAVDQLPGRIWFSFSFIQCF